MTAQGAKSPVMPLVECIPNFSEGRRPEVVEAIIDAIRSVSGVIVLDSSSDPDHNRSVVTFVGEPAAVEQAAFQAIRTAASLIDMAQHGGEHPRIGATDVVPFVPIRGVSMPDCVAMAQRLGQRVGDELDIPVYLYERAASRPDRENLATLRKGEYEGLREAIQRDPERAPDFGPTEMGSAGATVIGARAPLVAYNIYLNTDDVETANRIARAIRHSNGGLRYVKALGMLVEGRAQISMNLTDFTRTPIHRVQEMVRTEAARYGYAITHSELVGLIPEQALFDSARWYLQLDLFDEDQILERTIAQAESGSQTLAPLGFIDAVASGDPTPGGGSAAALAATLAAALAGMVARTTLGKKKYAEAEDQMEQAIARADDVRGDLTTLIDADADAFNQVMDAYRLDKTDQGRPAAIEAAMKHAADVPLRTMELTVEALKQLEVAARLGNVNAATDAAAGAHLALAALEAAALNVKVNANSLSDEMAAEQYRQLIKRYLMDGRALAQAVIRTAGERSGLD